mgnify:CR=1 FL=1
MLSMVALVLSAVVSLPPALVAVTLSTPWNLLVLFLRTGVWGPVTGATFLITLTLLALLQAARHAEHPLNASLLMESLQMLLPVRVPSNLDWALNVGGAWAGAVVASGLAWAGLIERWGRFRDRWFESEATGALALLALWPLALLFPAPVPFGLGQVLERLETALVEVLQDTPWLEWWPLREVELEPLLPMTEVLCVALGLCLPCLLMYGVVRRWQQRLVLAVLCLLMGLMASALSAALTYGPAHAWGWVSPEVLIGVLLAVLLASAVLWSSARFCWSVALAALLLQLSLLNDASADVYFAMTLQTWEQGRFIRFHGLIQWLGWLWPYALLAYLVEGLTRERPLGRT